MRLTWQYWSARSKNVVDRLYIYFARLKILKKILDRLILSSWDVKITKYSFYSLHYLNLKSISFRIIISRAKKTDWPLATSLVLYRLTDEKIMFEKYRGNNYPRVFGAKSDAQDKRLISSVQFDCFDFLHLCWEFKWALFYVRTWILIKHDNNFRIFHIMLSFGYLKKMKFSWF